MDRFHRWVWDEFGGYTPKIESQHADEWMNHLAVRDCSDANKAGHQKALLKLMKWHHHERGAPEWEPPFRFSDHSGTIQLRDYLTREERTELREAALEYGSIPAYGVLSPSKRDRWKANLAQRFEKPRDAVTPDDWDRANDWKSPSLV